jgi:Skp family chaperone for outer membrane proteins
MFATALAGAASLAAAVAPSVPPPAAPGQEAAQPIVGGPVVPGVCVFSAEAVIGGSKAGKAANLRFQQLAREAQTELQAQKASLDAETKGVEASAKTAAASELLHRRADLSLHATEFQQKMAQRNRELEYTRVKVVQQISQQAQPLIAAAYASHRCGLLLRREDMLGGNTTNDLTPDVVRSLDQKMTSLTFDRERLPAAEAAKSAS